VRTEVGTRGDGEPVTDPLGRRWTVRRWPAGVLPVPADPPDAGALALLLSAPPGAPVAGAATGPRPHASWVMGRSARWQGPGAAGAGDPLVDVLPALHSLALGGLPRGEWLGSLAVRLVDALRHSPARRRAPWVVELTDGRRTARWAAAGPRGADRAAAEVCSAVRAGVVPAAAGCRLVEVRDDPARG
jgi:hypothetical protein